MDAGGRVKADRVTGPMGQHVQGVARRSFRDFDGGSRGGNSSSNYEMDDFESEMRSK